MGVGLSACGNSEDSSCCINGAYYSCTSEGANMCFDGDTSECTRDSDKDDTCSSD